MNRCNHNNMNNYNEDKMPFAIALCIRIKVMLESDGELLQPSCGSSLQIKTYFHLTTLPTFTAPIFTRICDSSASHPNLYVKLHCSFENSRGEEEQDEQKMAELTYKIGSGTKEFCTCSIEQLPKVFDFYLNTFFPPSKENKHRRRNSSGERKFA